MVKFCPICENRIELEDSQFCNKCGAKLPITSSAPQPLEKQKESQKSKLKIPSGYGLFGIKEDKDTKELEFRTGIAIIDNSLNFEHDPRGQNWMLLFWFALFLVAGLVGIVLVMSNSPSISPIPTTKAIANAPSQQIYNIGETVTRYDRKITVLSPQTPSSISISDPKIKLLSFPVVIENLDSDKLFVSDTDFTMSDSEGIQYNSFTVFGGWFEDVMPNLKITRHVTFSIPKSATELKIHYDAGPSLTGQKILIWKVS